MARKNITTQPFDRENPLLWFSTTESQMQRANITRDGDKYNVVLRALDKDTRSEVSDIISAPLKGNAYATLKYTIISRRSQSLWEVGKKRPSDYLRHLRVLAGNGVPESFLKRVWLSRLPIFVSMQMLKYDDSTNLNQNAIEADKYYDNLSEEGRTYGLLSIDTCVKSAQLQVAASSTNQNVEKRLNELSNTVKELKLNVDALVQRQEEEDGSCTSSNQSKILCWYHKKFGANATKCYGQCEYGNYYEDED